MSEVPKRPSPPTIATADGVADDHVLRLVAAAERESEHPLAEAIVAAAEQRGLGSAKVDSSTSTSSSPSR